MRLKFEAPQWAATPGQSAVLYNGKFCQSGGVTASALVPTLPPALPPVRSRRRRGLHSA